MFAPVRVTGSQWRRLLPTDQFWLFSARVISLVDNLLVFVLSISDMQDFSRLVGFRVDRGHKDNVGGRLSVDHVGLVKED